MGQQTYQALPFISVMFDGEELVGIVDFEEVCHGPLLLDVGMVRLLFEV